MGSLLESCPIRPPRLSFQKKPLVSYHQEGTFLYAYVKLFMQCCKEFFICASSLKPGGYIVCPL